MLLRSRNPPRGCRVSLKDSGQGRAAPGEAHLKSSAQAGSATRATLDHELSDPRAKMLT